MSLKTKMDEHIENIILSEGWCIIVGVMYNYIIIIN